MKAAGKTGIPGLYGNGSQKLQMASDLVDQLDWT